MRLPPHALAAQGELVSQRMFCPLSGLYTLDMTEALLLIEPMEWLTIGLVIFAGAQIWVQVRAELQRKAERRADKEEAIDRAFQYVWAEHLRLEGLADELDRRDLIEMAFLGVLRSEEVLPRDWSKLIEAMASLSREAGFLGGMGVGLCNDVERAIRILVTSIESFATHGPIEVSPPERVQWLRHRYGKDVAQWEIGVRRGVRELANLLWDVARHNPRIALDRRLDFADDLESDFAKAAVKALLRRSGQATAGSTKDPSDSSRSS